MIKNQSFKNMKKLVIVFLIVIGSGYCLDANAQMSKKDKKAWSKRLKAMSPEDLKTILDENKSLQGQVSSLRSELGGIDQTIADKDEQIAQYQSQVQDLRSQLNQAKAQAQKSATQARNAPRTTGKGNMGTGVNDKVGIVFKVQIGAFRNKDLSKYLEASENFSGESENGLKKYSLGVFRDYWEADTFKKYLREMGVKDAWIVSFKDGKRVPIKEVLESVSAKKS